MQIRISILRLAARMDRLGARMARLEKPAAQSSPVPFGNDTVILSLLGSVMIGITVPIVVYGAGSAVVKLTK